MDPQRRRPPAFLDPLQRHPEDLARRHPHQATDDAQKMMQMGGRFGVNPTMSLGAEKDSLDIIQHDWALSKMEKHAEDLLKKLLKK